MALLHGRDLLSSKYITAEIWDASGRIWFVPIKFTIGNYFLAKIEGKTYVFDLRGEKGTYKQTLAKSFQIIRYDTSHYKPISSKAKELEIVIKKNGLPRIDGLLNDVLAKLGKRERNDFVKHNLNELIEEVADYGNKKMAKVLGKNRLFEESAKNLINFLDNLNVEEIVTPVKKVSEYIQDDIKACPADFLGQAFNMQQIADIEHRKITNTPLSPARAWVKPLVLVLIIAFVGTIFYMGYNDGWFDGLGLGGLTDGFGAIGEAFKMQGGGSNIGSNIVELYPTPEAAKAAINAGKVKLSDFPPDMRPLIQSVKVGATPVP